MDRRSVLLGAVSGLMTTKAWAAEPSTQPDTTPSSQPTPQTPVALVPTELLMHATVRLECRGKPLNPDLPTPTSIGTGFFFNLFPKDNHAVTVIVTNKHVIKGMISGAVELTPAKPDGTPDVTKHFRAEL